MIQGGYYIKARKIQSSDIATMPPCTREVWDWLLRNANYKDNGIFKRGQCFCRLQDIMNGLKWFVGYRKMTYSKSQCENATKHLTKHNMITTMKTTRGLLVTICNYDYYQTPENYEANDEDNKKPTRNKSDADTIPKKVKKDKKEKPIGDSETETPKSDLYKKMMSMYDSFCIKEINASANINESEGASLKKIIAYLKKGKDGIQKTDEAILKNFNYILSNFEYWNEFNKKNIKLAGINSNITNIIHDIKTNRNVR